MAHFKQEPVITLQASELNTELIELLSKNWVVIVEQQEYNSICLSLYAK